MKTRNFLLCMIAFLPSLAWAELHKDDRVTTERFGTGYVQEVYSTTAWVRFDSGNSYYNVNISDIFKATSCYASICVNTHATSNQGPGVVQEVFENGTTMFQIVNGPRYWNMPVVALARAVSCYAGICQGRRVMNYNYGPGQVVEVYENATAWVNFDRGVSYFNVPTQALDPARE